MFPAFPHFHLSQKVIVGAVICSTWDTERTVGLWENQRRLSSLRPEATLKVLPSTLDCNLLRPTASVVLHYCVCGWMEAGKWESTRKTEDFLFSRSTQPHAELILCVCVLFEHDFSSQCISSNHLTPDTPCLLLFSPQNTPPSVALQGLQEHWTHPKKQFDVCLWEWEDPEKALQLLELIQVHEKKCHLAKQAELRISMEAKYDLSTPRCSNESLRRPFITLIYHRFPGKYSTSHQNDEAFLIC